MKRTKPILAILICVAMTLALFPSFTAFAETYSGSCGDSVTWELDTSTGVLTISGTGDMREHSHPWYGYRDSITSVVIEDGVTSIGSDAFYTCYAIQSVTIPDSVTSIGSSAFRGCEFLQSVTIPSGIKSIGSNAFADCISLQDVFISDLTAWCGIEFDYDSNPLSYADNFYINDVLTTEIVIPEGITEIKAYTFCGFTALTSLSIPEGVTIIGSNAFNGCTALQNVTIPASVTSMADGVFHDCESLAEVNFSEGLTSIGEETFYGCTALQSVAIPASVTYIGNAAFLNCSALAEITIAGIAEIGPSAFSNTAYYNDQANWSGGTLYIGDCHLIAANPDEIIGEYSIAPGTVVIAGEVFSGCSSMTDVTIPDSVTIIGDSAFSRCTALTGITIPDSVTSMRDNVFYYCENLASVTLGSGITSIAGDTFRNCSALKSLIIPESVTSIGDSAFEGCSSLETITIPESVTSIGTYYAFRNCSSLTSIVIPDGVTYIGMYTFQNCSNLTSVTIPDGVTVIGSYDFYGCSSLESVTLPANVTNIYRYAFYGCSALQSVTIPVSVTTIGENAFGECQSLSSVTYAGEEDDWNRINMSDGNDYLIAASGYSVPTIYSGTFGDNLTWELDTITGVLTISGTGDMPDYSYPWSAYRDSITSIVINDGVTRIGCLSFISCSALQTITVPDSVTSIGDAAFQNCGSLESIAIPNGVTSIDNYTFRYCGSLASVSIPTSVTSIGQEAFGDCRNLSSVTYAGSEDDWNDINIQDGNDYLKTAYENSNFAEIEWNITDGVLTISGTGRMPDYEDADENRAPWYEYNESITSVVVNEGLTSIGSEAFNELWNVETVSLPDTLTKIQSCAFRHCYNLQSITIPDSVTTIGSYAFEECVSLTEITIPANVSDIGNSLFNGCGNLSAIYVDENNSSYCTQNNILYTSDMTCLICCPAANSSVSDFVIPDSVTDIWTDAFLNCSYLTSVTIPDSITCINTGTFNGCGSLRDVTLPVSVTYIAWSAFGTGGLLNVYYGGTEDDWNNITIEDENNALINAYAYTTGYALNGATDLAWSLSDGTLTISGNGWMPNYGASWGAESTDEYRPEWYAERDEITSIVIKDGITRIGNFAFQHLTNAISVTIADSVTEIGYQSFQFCSSLESVKLSVNTTLIEAYAFDGCEILSSVSYDGSEDNWNNISIEDGNDYLRGAYENSLYFADVEWNIDENGVLTISGTGRMPDYDDNDESRAPWYEYKDSITDVVIKEGLTSVGNHAFNTFNQITSVSLPEGIDSIGSWSFCGCTNLQSITFPESLNTISCNAFEACESITAVHIPQNVTYIDFFAFGGCNNIASLTADENNSCYYAENNALYFNDKTELVYYAPASEAESLEILDNVTGIWGSALRWCTNLVSVTLPDGVDNIGSYAFDGCNNLAQITIPASITFIGEYAFSDCWNLSSVTYSGSEDDWNNIEMQDGNECLQNAYENSRSTVYSGTCGDNLTWQLDTASGTLTVDGTGDMELSSEAWQDYKPLITSIVINDGVTKIASNAFSGCEMLVSVTISDSVTAIESDAFADCDNLTDVYYTADEDAWNEISIDADNDPLSSAEIHYYYGYTTAPVTIKYCDTDGNSISDDVTRTALLNETYTVPDNLKSLASSFDGTFVYSYSLIDSESCDSIYVTEDGENVCTLVFEVTATPLDTSSTGNLITNSDFATGDTTGWTNRLGGDITDYTIAYDDTIGCNVLSMSTGGRSATNNIGTHWSVTPGKTYSFSFMVYADVIDVGNYTYNRLTDAYNMTSEGNYENAGNDLLAWAEKMTFGEWNTLSVTFTAETDTIYFQSSWVDSIKFANFTLKEVSEEENTVITIPTVVEYENAVEAQAAITESGEITVTLTITDENVISAENITVFTASYNDGTAESVNALTKTITDDGAVFTGTVSENYRIFIWDNNMRPLTQSSN